ncbi:MAG: hypothetical protein L0228_13820 [Planctomycetes bacterium]|nr:hypothetical protein [Planctomycetota bacterium]
MRNFLRRLIGSGDPLADAGRRHCGEAFVHAVEAADIFVLAAMQSEGLDAATFTQEQLLAEIERSARDLSERQDGFEPFVYRRDGVSCLPFFSSQEHCEVFCGEYSKLRNRVLPFQVLGIKGSVLAVCSSSVERLILNDWTADERPISAEEKRLLEKDVGLK